MKAWLLQYRTLIFVVLTLISWSVLFYFVSPEALVEGVGIGNAYLISFLISLLAGFSILTASGAYAAVVEFARGGANPLYLGLISGVGLFLSDSAFYLLATRGREELSTKFGRWFTKFHELLSRLPNIVVYIGVYLFCAIGPIPDDILMTVMVIGGYEYKKLWPALLAGDITFMLFLSYLFQQ